MISKQPPSASLFPLETATERENPQRLESSLGDNGPTTLPRLPTRRSGLVIRQLAETGSYVIKDPRNGSYYQLGQEELFLLNQCNGTQPQEAICAAFEQRFEQPLDASELDSFLELAHRRELLEDDSIPEVRRVPCNNDCEQFYRASASQRRAQSLLYWRKNIFDPDRLFAWLAPGLGFLWSRAFLLLSGGCVLVAIGVFWTNRHQLGDALAHLVNLQTAVWAWLVLVIVGVLHESAHGLTCKRFGGEVHEIGFRLLYFQPAFYCNVSDAWLFAEKSRRLWVTFAGAYCELLLWSTAILFWRITEPGTWPNSLALVMIGMTGLTTLLNLNPLIKLDGYYLLSDYLEVPNLRSRAFRYLRSRLIGWRPAAFQNLDPTARDLRIFWIYGLVAGGYSFWLLSIIIISAAKVMTGRYQGWGLFLFAVLVFYLFRRPLRRMAHVLGAHVRSAPAMVVALKRLGKGLVVLGLTSVLLFIVRCDLKVSGEFSLMPLQNVDVRTEVEGIIEEITKDEGELVQAGEVVARLSDRDYRADLNKIQAELEEKNAGLKLLKAGARREEIELAKITVTKNEARLGYARDLLAMEKSLFEAKLSSRKDFQAVEELLSLRQSELGEAQGVLKVILAGTRPEEIEAMQAEISRLSAQRDYLEQQVQRLAVRSPINGVITTHRPKEKVGNNIRKGEVIANVKDFNSVTAEISVSEKEIAEVKLGQRIVLRTRALPAANLESTVLSIAPIAIKPSNAEGGRMVLVTTQIQNADLRLKPEMSGQAKIYCGKRRLGELLTRHMARYLKVEFWSWW